jgi:hypothetical protein
VEHLCSAVYSLVDVCSLSPNVSASLRNYKSEVMTKKEKKLLDDKLKAFLKRLEKPEIIAVFKRLKDK